MITGQPNNEMITALQDVMFTCVAKGFEVKYLWKQHKNNIIGKQSTLPISEATPLDEDQYYCVAMTEGGYAFSNNVTLTVDGKNTILLIKSNQAHATLKPTYVYIPVFKNSFCICSCVLCICTYV